MQMMNFVRAGFHRALPSCSARAVVLGVFAAMAMGFASSACAVSPQSDESDAIRIKSLSSAPDLVSGGEVLIRVDLPAQARTSHIRVDLDGQDVTTMFQADPQTGALTGLVTGLKVGKNTLTVFDQENRADSLKITNYPLTGPITSGPHEVPFICTAADYRIFSSLLGPVLPYTTTFNAPTDANCSAPTKITYLYMPKGGTVFQLLPSTTSLPADVSTTTTLTGASVNFIVRFETSTIDRGIYQSAILHDPTSDPVPTWNSPPKGWNKRLIAIEGAGCPGGADRLHVS